MHRFVFFSFNISISAFHRSTLIQNSNEKTKKKDQTERNSCYAKTNKICSNLTLPIHISWTP